MGQITRDQSHTIMAILATNAVWDEIDFDQSRLQDLVVRKAQEAGRHFTAFLKNGARVIVGEPRVIPIGRSTPFNPAEFIGKDWTIEEQDERSLALTEVDLTAISFETMLKDGETHITGEEKLKRLKSAGHIRLDAKVFQTFWENQHLIPERFKEKTNDNTTYIFFDGTVLRGPSGRRFVLYLCWLDDGWYWHFYWLAFDWGARSPSAVLASI